MIGIKRLARTSTKKLEEMKSIMKWRKHSYLADPCPANTEEVHALIDKGFGPDGVYKALIRYGKAIVCSSECTWYEEV